MLENNGDKWLTAQRLVQLLSEVPPDSRVMVNAVGNLLIKNASGNQLVAYIDFFAAGELEPYS